MSKTALVNLGDIQRLPHFGEWMALIDLRDERRPVRLSAFELDERCRALARGLARRGVGRGARIGILAENRYEFFASYAGIMRLGAVAVPVNHRLPRATVEHIFKDSAIALTFCDAPRRALVPQGVPVIEFDAPAQDSGSFESLLDPGEFETYVPDEQALAEILYTSGSTGLPKGVPLTHRGQLWAMEEYLLPFAAELPHDSTLIVAPLYHMNALFNITMSLASRVTVLLLPRFDVRRYLETVAEQRCTQLSGIPTMFALMVRERDLAERLDLSSVVDITIGSAPLTDALLEHVRALFPNAHVENGFGTTEAGPAVFGPHPAGSAAPAAVGRLSAAEHRLPSGGGRHGRPGRSRPEDPGAHAGLSQLAAGDGSADARWLVYHGRCHAPGYKRVLLTSSGARMTCSCAAERMCIPARWRSSSSATRPSLKPSWCPRRTISRDRFPSRSWCPGRAPLRASRRSSSLRCAKGRRTRTRASSSSARSCRLPARTRSIAPR